MAHETGAFRGAGDVEIHWQAWRPESEPRATVVLAHGLSEHSSRYAHVAEAFNERGYSLWAVDHRGHGKSGGQPVYVERFGELVEDLHSFLTETAATESPDRKPFLLGHSMGGCVATGYAVRHDSELAGLVLSNPLATIKTAPGTVMVGRLLSRIAPRLGVYSVPAEGVSKDPEVVRDYEQDPLNFHGKVPARTVAELGDEVETFSEAVGAITVPVLVMYSSTDPIVAPEGSEMLAQRVGSSDVTIRDWPGLRHEILNEPERDEVIAAMLDWLDARV